MKRIALAIIALAVTASVGIAEPAFGQRSLSGDAKKEAERFLDELLMEKALVAKVTFPAWKDGINLRLDGSWNPSEVTRDIKDHGVGIDIDETVMVTDVKLKGKHIEIHLNGGGRGTFGDELMEVSTTAGSGARQAGGSRINLRFDRNIQMEDLTAAQLAAWLNPIIDVSALERDAALAELPEEFREAAARGDILVGMTKRMVFAIMGEPANKSVDLDKVPPVEKWQYDVGNMEMLVVTIVGGEVTQIDRY